MILTNLDRWDRREFNECLESNQTMQGVEQNGTRKVHNFADVMLDIFGGLYKFNPEVRDKESAPSKEHWADDVYSEISQLQEWRDLRERTKVNPDAAAAATAEFCNHFMDAIPDKNARGKWPEIDKDEIMSGVRRAARDACGHAVKVADETNEMLQAMGFGSGNGRPQYAAPTAKREIAQRLQNSEHLKQIALLTGRMRRIAGEKQKQKTKHGVDELADITVGNDLARLIPAEIMKLAHPLLKLDFQKRFLERHLVQYKLRGREKKGYGPLIVCVDESGSMEGNRDIWSKSVALALLQIAQQQKRKYVMIHFDSDVCRIDEFDGKTDSADIMDAISYFANGGTDYEAPLSKAEEIITQNSQYKDADIVFITDGVCTVSDEWLKRFNKSRKDNQFNVISVMIGYGAEACKPFSDKIVSMDDLTEDGDALDAMFTL